LAAATSTLVLDWDGTVTEVDTLHLVLEQFGDVTAYRRAEDALGRSLTLHEVIALEFETVRAPLEEVVAWVLENSRIRRASTSSPPATRSSSRAASTS
jgi:2-hydroxy-3-keto-5-methylthiopentenyl-1-phosphate phosphatase